MPDRLSGKIGATLTNLKRWCAEDPPLLEGAIEAFLLFELFRAHLGFNKNTAKRQVQDVDILLKIDPHNSVVVEVKKPRALAGRSNLTAAIKQAAGYMAHLPKKQGVAEYGIVTDGYDWFYFKVSPNGDGTHRANVLLWFNIRQHPQIAMQALTRSTRNKLLALLKMLEAIHLDMSEADLVARMNLSLNDRVDQLWAKVPPEVKGIVQGRSLLRLLYDARHHKSDQLIDPVLKPIDL
jgi:hypothetical protein